MLSTHVCPTSIGSGSAHAPSWSRESREVRERPSKTGHRNRSPRSSNAAAPVRCKITATKNEKSCTHATTNKKPSPASQRLPTCPSPSFSFATSRRPVLGHGPSPRPPAASRAAAAAGASRRRRPWRRRPPPAPGASRRARRGIRGIRAQGEAWRVLPLPRGHQEPPAKEWSLGKGERSLACGGKVDG